MSIAILHCVEGCCGLAYDAALEFGSYASRWSAAPSHVESQSNIQARVKRAQ